MCFLFDGQMASRPSSSCLVMNRYFRETEGEGVAYALFSSSWEWGNGMAWRGGCNCINTNGDFVLPEESELVLLGVKKGVLSSGTYPYSLCIAYIYPERTNEWISTTQSIPAFAVPFLARKKGPHPHASSKLTPFRSPSYYYCMQQPFGQINHVMTLTIIQLFTINLS